MRSTSVLALIAVMLVVASPAGAMTSGAEKKKPKPPGYTWRWDVATTGGGILNPRGAASALADDGSKLTISSANGKFSKPGRAVSGGGSWIAYDPTGAVMSVGTFTIKSLIGFFPVAGALPATVTVDNLGAASRATAGLAAFSVSYSNGYSGSLVLGSKLEASPASALSGFTATWGPLAFLKPISLPASPTDFNRIAFHRLK